MNTSTSIFIAFLFAVALVSCKQDDHVAKWGEGDGCVSGRVTDDKGTPLSGVSVRCGIASSPSNANGYYKLDNTAEGEVTVKYEKAGYVTGFKKTKAIAFKTSIADVALYQVRNSTKINAENGGVISGSGVEIHLPSNAFQDKDGNAVSGEITVEFTNFLPTDEYFIKAFPGNFTGIRTNGKETAIESFGFIDVELKNTEGVEVRLASGKEAVIKMTFPSDVIDNAPATIPTWYFDEEEFVWKKDGKASLSGRTYSFSVSHFSKWNIDMPFQTSYLQGFVKDQNGTPLYHAKVEAVGVDYFGSSETYTDIEGFFRLAVKYNSEVKIYAVFSGFSGNAQVQTAILDETKDIGTIVIFLLPENPQKGWYSLLFPFSFDINEIKFYDENFGFAVADNIYKTTDGGLSWFLSYKTEDKSCEYFEFLNSATAVFSNGKDFIKTTDKGRTWNNMTYYFGAYIFGIDFLNDKVGFLSADSLYKTTDGGYKWSSVSPRKAYCENLYVIDENILFLESDKDILFSSDGGLNWINRAMPSTEISAWSLLILSPDRIYAFGGESYEKGLYLSTDKALSWKKLSDQYFRSVFFIDNTGWATDQEYIYKSSDAGTVWQKQTNIEYLNFNKLFFLNKNRGWASGLDGILYRTDNGGEK